MLSAGKKLSIGLQADAAWHGWRQEEAGAHRAQPPRYPWYRKTTGAHNPWYTNLGGFEADPGTGLVPPPGFFMIIIAADG